MTLVSDTAHCRTRTVAMHVERYYMMAKLPINRKYITIPDAYAPNTNVLKHRRQKK